MSRMSSLNHVNSGASDEEDAKATPLSEQAELTISQMSRLYGVSLRTLRFYEDRGLIKPRREGNARYYRGVSRSHGDDPQGQEARIHAHRDQ